MTNIVVKIRDGVATAELTGILTNGMVGVPVFFDLGPEWEDLTVIAVIRGNDLTFDRPLLGTRQTTVPFEVLEKVGEHIYIGAEGCSASGDLVIQSNMAKVEEPVRQGADPSGDIAMDPTQPFWAELMHEVEELRKGVAERVKTVNGIAPDENGNVVAQGGGSGITTAEKALILSLFKNTAYTADMSATLAQLEALWSGSGEMPDEPDKPVAITYKVTNNLTNVSTTNAAATIEQGAIYVASLSADDGYEISGVTVTMGGEDVTATYYANGAVSIPSVTGDIVITAVAEVPASADWNIMYCQDGSDLANATTTSAHCLAKIDTGNSNFWAVWAWDYNGVRKAAVSMYFYTNQGGARGTINLTNGYIETKTYTLGAYRFHVGKYDISSIIEYMNGTDKSWYGDIRDPRFEQGGLAPHIYAAQREITEDMLRAITGIG